MPTPSTAYCGLLAPDDPRWAAALRGVPHDLFHTPEYLDATRIQTGEEPRLFLLDAGSHGLLVPMMIRSLAPFGEAYRTYRDAVSPYGYPGPLTWGGLEGEAWSELFQRFEATLREAGIVSLFLRLNPFLGPSAERLAAHGQVVAHGPTVFLDLRDPEGSWQGIQESNRRFIKQQLRQGCSVGIDQWDTMDAVIQAYTETMLRLSASPEYLFPKAYFERLRDGLPDSFHIATSFAPDGAVTGGAFFSEAGGLVQHFLSGAFGAHQALSPGKILINAVRLWGIERGHHTLHLGGGLGARKDNLYVFKERFAKTMATFCTFRKVLLPEVYEALVQATGMAGSDWFPTYRDPRPQSSSPAGA